MTTRNIRTREQEEMMHEKFTALVKQIKPIPHDIDCIRILKKIKPAIEYHRLAVKNEGGKQEKPWRAKRFIAEKDSIINLEGYLKSKAQ